MSAQRMATTELVRLFDTGSLSGLSEWELLVRFVSRRDELAFETLVARHAPMVLGVCRRMLGASPEVDDAFQATFLVLFKRAHTLGPRDAVAAWLHGVAVRVSRKARSDGARRARRERLGVVAELAAPDLIEDDPELRQILDEELNRLPYKYRAPVVLCYLEGQTHEQAARRLGWPIGTVKGRLSRARSLLESRLSRRGVACSAGLTALAAGSSLDAAVPAPLLEATFKAAAALGAGSLSAQALTTSVSSLLQGVLSAMLFQKLRTILLTLAVSGLFVTGAGVMARQQSGSQGQVTRKGSIPQKGPQDQPRGDIAKAKVYVPPGELVGISEELPDPKALPTELPRRERTIHELYQDLRQAARQSYLDEVQTYGPGATPLERIYNSSRVLMDAENQLATTPAEKTKAAQEHVDRMLSLARLMNEHHGSEIASPARFSEAKQYIAEAELLLAQAKTPKPATSPKPAPQGNTTVPGDKQAVDPRSQFVLDKLEKPISMSFASETPLEDVLKYIKQATTGEKDAGIPIYVDPIGLQEAEKSMNSPVQLDLEGVPLRRTLQLMLHPLGLAYFVDDGILVITSEEAAEASKLPPTTAEASAFKKKRERAEKGEMTIPELQNFVEELRARKEMVQLLKEIEKQQVGGGGVQ